MKFRDVAHMDIKDDEGNWYHPNIRDRQINNKRRALQYCSKEDPNPLCYNMDIKEETKARESHSKILTKRILTEGVPLAQLVEQGEIPLNQLPQWERGLVAYKRMKKEDKPDLPATLPNPWKKDLPIHTDRK